MYPINNVIEASRYTPERHGHVLTSPDPIMGSLPWLGDKHSYGNCISDSSLCLFFLSRLVMYDLAIFLDVGEVLDGREGSML